MSSVGSGRWVSGEERGEQALGVFRKESGEASWRSVGKRWKESPGPTWARFCPLGQQAVHHVSCVESNATSCSLKWR